MSHSLAVSIPIRQSQTLAWALVLAHIAAASAVLVASIPNGLAAILLFLVGVSAARQRRPDMPDHLSLQGDGRFSFSGSNGMAMTVDPSSAVIGSLVVLRYANGGRMRSKVLARDCFANDEDRRRFRRWFLWQVTDTGKLNGRG